MFYLNIRLLRLLVTEDRFPKKLTLLRQHTTRDEPDTRASHLHGAWAKTNRPMTFLSVPVHFPNEPPLRAQKAHATKEDIQIHINHSYDSSLYIKGASVPCPSYEILTFVLKKKISQRKLATRPRDRVPPVWLGAACFIPSLLDLCFTLRTIHVRGAHAKKPVARHGHTTGSLYPAKRIS